MTNKEIDTLLSILDRDNLEKVKEYRENNVML